MQNQYFIIIDGQQAGPFSKEELQQHMVRPESLVWRQGLPDWIKASDLPEIAEIIVSPEASPSDMKEERRWFAMINDKQVGPYTAGELISMGMTPQTPVWTDGMAD